RGRLARRRAGPDELALLELRLERTDLLDVLRQPRVRQLAALHEVEHRPPEVVVGLPELALRLDLLHALLRPCRRLLGCCLRLVQKSHAVSSYSPRMFPNRPLPLRSPPPLAACMTRLAVRPNGSVWSVTWPGPVMCT